MKRTFLLSIVLLASCAVAGWRGAFDEAFAAASSAWTPLKLGSKLACWFDADDPATVLNADGDPAADAEAVQTWRHKSGNGRHATAPTESNRPTRRANVQNGRAVVRTDGDDQLDIGSAGGVFRNKAAGYIFAVAKDTNQEGGAAAHRTVYFSTVGVAIVRAALYGRAAGGVGWAAGGRRLDADAYAVAHSGLASGHNLCQSFFD